MKKLLIDCGGNLGDGFTILDNIIHPDSVVIFEPNPSCYNFLLKKFSTDKFQILNKAVGTSNENVKFHIPKKDEFSLGSTIHNDFHNSKEILEYNTIDVGMIDLSEYIKGVSDFETYLKLDVEGSEYEIMEKLISDETIFKIKKVYVEFHEQYMSNEFIEKYDFTNRKDKILSFLTQNNIEYQIWH